MKRTLCAGSILGGLLLAWGVASAGGIGISEPWIRHIPGRPSAGYFQLHNDSGDPVRLVGAESPAFGKVMLHRTRDKGGSTRMEHVDAIEVSPGETLRFAPGGYHLMLMQPRRELAVGETVSLTLRFAEAGERTIEFPVRPPYARGPE